MRFFQKYFLLFLLVSFGSCKITNDEGTVAAIEGQMALYPESTLQDLYKAFFQSEFGPEHIIADTLSAGRYLDDELRIPDYSSVYYEPLGADSSYFRVHLCAVQNGLVSRDELFDAFVSGSRAIEPRDILEWKGKWHSIVCTIESMNLSLTDFDFDQTAIDSLLNSGHYAFHHSRKFRDCYAPHYRIVRKDIFYENLYGKLSDSLSKICLPGEDKAVN